MCFLLCSLLSGYFCRIYGVFSVAKAGLFLLFMTVIFGVTSPVGGKLVDKVGARIPLFIGLGLLVVACALFCADYFSSDIYFPCDSVIFYRCEFRYF